MTLIYHYDNNFIDYHKPSMAQKRVFSGGKRKTSAWMIFHPFSSSATSSSSSTLYLAKSFRRTRV